MNKRLQTFLEIEQLSPAQLAAQLGIQRSGISHILAGRNKPGYDFLHSLLSKFPDINAEWLITGVGKPLKSDSTPINSSIMNLDNIAQQSSVQNITPKIDKEITKITVFYSDGTFSDFSKE